MKLGEDIIAHYKPYVNTKTVWKKTPIEEYEFEMDERYEIVRVRRNLVKQSEREPTVWWPKPSTK